jgi:hypothetical protein
MTWDGADDYVLLFGGSNISNPGTQGGPPNLNDTWAFSNGSWTELFPLQSPPPTDFAAMSYDPDLQAVVMFGGQIDQRGAATPTNSTWEFRAGNWFNVTSATAPSPRIGASLSLDPQRNGLVLFGGLQISPFPVVPEADTWTFDNGTWSNITASVGGGPTGRYLAGMTYDPQEDGTILFGGWQDLSDYTPVFNDTWLLGAGGWTDLSGAVAPPAAGGMGFAYLSASQEIVSFGGWSPTLGSYFNQTWSFKAGGWSELFPATSPPATFAGALVDDAELGQGILLLGSQNSVAPASEQTWSFANGNWSVAGTNSSIPPAGAETMAFDEADQEVVLVPNSGTGITSGLTPTWVYRNGSWDELRATIAEGTLLAYDGADGYLLGYQTGPAASTWKFSNGSWIELFPQASPFPGSSGAIAYDARDGYVVYLDAGSDTSTWKWSAGNWSELSPTIQPGLGGETAGLNSMTYDAADGYLVLIQGSNTTCGSGSDCLLTWGFAGGEWTDLTGHSQTVPPPFVDGSVTYDSDSGQVILFGGYTVYGSCPECASNETWAYSGGQWTQVVSNATPPARFTAGITFDPTVSEVLLLGGQGSINPRYFEADMWALTTGGWTELMPSFSTSSLATDVGVPVTIDTLAPDLFGIPSYSYSGLPAGCATSDAGSINCVPALAGRYAIEVTVQYAEASPATGSGVLQVQNLPSISGFSASSNPVSSNSSLVLRSEVTGGTSPFTYTYAGLPPGCTSADVSALVCTPTTDGKYSVSLEVTDRFGRSDNATLQLTVGTTNGGVNLGAVLGWFASPLGEILLGVLVVAAATSSIIVVRTRRARAEGERLVEGMQRAISEGPEFGIRPP